MNSRAISSQWERSVGLGPAEGIVVPPPPASHVSVITVAVVATAVVETTAIAAISPTSPARTAPIAPASVATGMDGMVGVGMAVPSTPVEWAILVKPVGPLETGIPPVAVTIPARTFRPPVEPIVLPSSTGEPAGPTTTGTGLLTVL